LPFRLVLFSRQRLPVFQNQAGHRTILAFDNVADLIAPVVDRLHAIPQIRTFVVKSNQLVCGRVGYQCPWRD
jgi:hypothetical protein